MFTRLFYRGVSDEKADFAIGFLTVQNTDHQCIGIDSIITASRELGEQKRQGYTARTGACDINAFAASNFFHGLCGID